MDHVVGQVGLGESGESPQVGEQHGARDLLAGVAQRAGQRHLDVGLVAHQPLQGDVAAHARLAGQADLRVEALARRQPLLERVARHAVFQPVDHDHPAGGTAGAAAALADMRDAVGAGSLQDGLQRRRRYGLLAEVVDPDPLGHCPGVGQGDDFRPPGAVADESLEVTVALRHGAS